MDIDEVMTDQALPEDLNIELLRLSRKLEQATDSLRGAAVEFAEAENDYRRTKAQTYLVAKTANEKATIPQLEAIIDRESEKERKRAYLARAMKEATLEQVKSLRAQLSALQTIAATTRTEMEMTRLPQARY